MDDSAPGIGEILGHFAFDLPWIVVLVVPAFVYTAAWVREAARRPRVPFPRWKLVSWLGGLLCLGIGVLSPLSYYGDQLLSVNFASFLSITMLAPPLLCWGSPFTLAFRRLGKAGRGRLRRALRSRPARVLTFLPVPWLLFAVVTYIWQFAPPADRAAGNAFVRDFQQVTLFVVALAFWFPALAADPLRWRAAYPIRGLYLLVEMTHKAVFGAFFLSLRTPIHEGYAARIPAWGPSPIDDQVLAIVILWLGGNLVFMACIAGLAVLWVRQDAADGTRAERRMARAKEAERRRQEALGRIFERGI